MSVPRGHPAPEATEATDVPTAGSSMPGRDSDVHAAPDVLGETGAVGEAGAVGAVGAAAEIIASVAAGVHEVQNVLTSALGWIQLARASQSPEVHVRALAVVERALGRAGILVAALADPNARVRVEATVFDPAAVVSEVYELLHPRCTARGVELHALPLPPTVGAAPLGARGDPARASQVVTNLVINALEAVVAAREDRPTACGVTLGVTSTDSEVGITVRDDGTGIDPETRARMFEPRFTTRPGRGSGLGLSVARSLADAMGAWLTVATEPGRGSEVTLWLPRAQGTVGSHGGPVISGGPYGLSTTQGAGLRPGTRVLVLDDEPAIRELLEVALTLRGASVLAVGDLASARRALAHHGVDVALVDEALGAGVSGVSFIAEVAADWPSVGRVLMTGAPSIDHLAGACEHFVRKPFLLDDVVRALTSALPTPAPA